MLFFCVIRESILCHLQAFMWIYWIINDNMLDEYTGSYWIIYYLIIYDNMLSIVSFGSYPGWIQVLHEWALCCRRSPLMDVVQLPDVVICWTTLYEWFHSYCIYNIWKCILESKIRYTYYKYYTSNEHVWLSTHLVCKSMYIKLLEFLSPVFVRTRHRRLQRNLLRSLLRRKWAAGGVSLCVLSRRRCPFPIGWLIQRGFPIIYQNGLLFILSWVTDLDITSKYIWTTLGIWWSIMGYTMWYLRDS